MKRSVPILVLSLWATSNLVVARAQEYLPPQPMPEMTAMFECRKPVTQPAVALAEFLRAQGFVTLGPHQLEDLQGYSFDGDGDPFFHPTLVVAISHNGRIVSYGGPVDDAAPANYHLTVYPSSESGRAVPFAVALRRQISGSGRCHQLEVHYFPDTQFDASGYASLKARVQTALRVATQQGVIGSNSDARRPMTVHRLIIRTSRGLPKIPQTWSGDAVLLDLSREPRYGSATVELEPHQGWPSLIDLYGPLGFIHVTVRGALSADFSGIVPADTLLHLCRKRGSGVDICPPGSYRPGSQLMLSWN